MNQADIPLPQISLALVTYNQAHLLRGFLDNFLKYGAQLVNLTIIDDGSSDDTKSILSNLANNRAVKIQTVPHGSIAQARNHALRHSPTPWLAFSDTDCQLDGQYFKALLTIPERFQGFAAIEGAVNSPPGPKPPFTHSLANPKGGTFATANMVFHVPTILAMGGFDEEFKNFREDSDLALTILERCGPIPFFSELAVIHPHLPRKFISSLRNAPATQALIIRSEIRLYEKHPLGYARIRHHRHLLSTLKAWCTKYSAAFIRDGIQYLFWTRDLSIVQRLQGLFPSCAGVLVALWEQICVGALCLVLLPKLLKLKTR